MKADEIKEWLAKQGKNREWLAGQCKVSKSTVNGWLSADRAIPGPVASIIQNLMGGKIDLNPKLDLNIFIKAQQRAEKSGLSLDEWITSLIKKEIQEPDLKKLQEKVAEKPNFQITVVGNIAAGMPYAGDAPHKVVPALKDYGSKCYALKVNGSSMEPTIPDDSVIVVKKWETSDRPKEGTIVVYADERGVTLKEFTYRKTSQGKEPIFRSLNPSFPDVETMDGGSITAIFVEIL